MLVWINCASDSMRRDNASAQLGNVFFKDFDGVQQPILRWNILSSNLFLAVPVSTIPVNLYWALSFRLPLLLSRL